MMSFGVGAKFIGKSFSCTVILEKVLLVPLKVNR